MKPYKSLKRELTLTIAVMTTAICAIFSFGMSMALDAADDLLLDVHLETDITAYVAWYEQNPQILQLPHEAFDVYVVENGDRSKLPATVKALPEGEDDLFIDGREYDVKVARQGDTEFYFVIDESEFEEFEKFLLFAMFIIDGLVIGAALCFGRSIGNRIIVPLQNLANQVSALDDSSRHDLEIEMEMKSRNEITILGETLQSYHQRICEVLTREREFSADVSHELRTPLMAIHGAAELLERESAAASKSQDVLSRIKRGCNQMTALTEALLFLAREPSSFRDMIEPVSVKHVIQSQIEAVSDVTSKKGITVHLKQVKDATVNAIPAVINIVIGNILKNAIKYTDKKSINVFVENNSIVIQDYGPGMDDETRDKVFERFERGRNPARRRKRHWPCPGTSLL